MKRFISILMVLVIAFSFTACKKSDDPKPIKKGETQGSTVNGIDLSSFEGKKLYKYLEMFAGMNFNYQTYVTDSAGKESLVTCTFQDGYAYVYSKDQLSVLRTPDMKYYFVYENESTYIECTPALIAKLDNTRKSVLAECQKIIDGTFAIAINMLKLYPTDVTLPNEYKDYKSEVYLNPQDREYVVFFFDKNDDLKFFSVQNMDKPEEQAKTTTCLINQPAPGTISTILTTYTLIDENGNVLNRPAGGTVVQ